MDNTTSAIFWATQCNMALFSPQNDQNDWSRYVAANVVHIFDQNIALTVSLSDVDGNSKKSKKVLLSTFLRTSCFKITAIYEWIYELGLYTTCLLYDYFSA